LTELFEKLKGGRFLGHSVYTKSMWTDTIPYNLLVRTLPYLHLRCIWGQR